MKKHFIILLFLSILKVELPFAQDTKTSLLVDSIQESSYFEIGINYANNVVYMGRRDSIKTPYLSSNFGFYHKSGLFLSTSISYLTTSQKRVDLFTGTVGYGLDIGKFQGQLSTTKYIFHNKAYSVKSPVIWDVSLDLGFEFSFIDINITSISLWTPNSKDFLLGVELLKDHYEVSDRLQFSTSISLNFGSQNFYDQYFVEKSEGHTKRPGSPLSHQASYYIRDADKFNLLNVEWSLPINYLLNDFTFSFTPTLSFPFNDTKISDQGNVNEEIDDIFYWTIGIGHKFYGNGAKR